jgi:hypothetical protein
MRTNVIEMTTEGDTMRLKLYQEGAMTRDVPDENLKTGDVAVLIDVVRKILQPA